MVSVMGRTQMQVSAKWACMPPDVEWPQGSACGRSIYIGCMTACMTTSAACATPLLRCRPGSARWACSNDA